MIRDGDSEAAHFPFSMNFWIIHAQEPLPQPRAVATRRLWRSNTIAELLAARGHHVVRWRSGYSHYEKRYLVDGAPAIQFEDYQFQFLAGPPYRRHIGYGRVRHHEAIAAQFTELAARATLRPDAIHVSNVPIELCRAAVDFGATRRIPVVIDVRDLWPDLFLDLVPAGLSFLKPAVKLLLSASYRNAKYAMRHATAVTGITQPFVDWGVRMADRPATAWDQVFHMSYPELPAVMDDRRNLDLARKLGLMPEDFVCCYFGAIGYQSDFDTLIETARQLGSQSRVKLVICGEGPKLSALRAKAVGMHNILFPGWLDAADVQTLMQIATVGLIPFKECDNYVLNMPNKFSEYLSGGLVLACGLRGEMARLIGLHQCGLVYPSGDAAILAKRLTELSQAAPTHLVAMRNRARALFRDQFDYRVVYTRLCEYLEALPAHRAG